MRRLGLVAAIVVLALLVVGGYTASASAVIYGDLDGGRQALVAAQKSMTRPLAPAIRLSFGALPPSSRSPRSISTMPASAPPPTRC